MSDILKATKGKSESYTMALDVTIKYYEEITGESVLLNTSYNLHGYPIAYSPLDALEVFNNSGLKYLALGNFLIKKNT